MIYSLKPYDNRDRNMNIVFRSREQLKWIATADKEVRNSILLKCTRHLHTDTQESYLA